MAKKGTWPVVTRASLDANHCLGMPKVKVIPKLSHDHNTLVDAALDEVATCATKILNSVVNFSCDNFLF